MAKKIPLVLVEWQDSTQPIPGWTYLSDLAERATKPCYCRSVGFLLSKTKETVVLAPNVANMGDTDNEQASGVIRIPARSVTKMLKLRCP